MELRVNIYGFPHKGIRYGLGQLSFKVGSLIFDDIDSLNACKEIADDFSELLDLHLHAEEDFVLQPLEARVPGSTQHNREDHLEMERLEHDMNDSIRQLVEAPNEMHLNIAYDKINNFIIEYFRHMSEEETIINKVLWDNFTDQEILGMQGQILAKLTPDQFFKWFKYIIPSLSQFEQSIMLGGFKENAPTEAYNITIKNLEPYLTPNQFAYISSL
ncbi:MAG: hemerythrin domain-containing protein [Ignavibacteriaceae bacterium]